MTDTSSPGPPIPQPYFPCEETTLELCETDISDDNADVYVDSSIQTEELGFALKDKVPRVSVSSNKTPNFFDWSTTYPQLQMLLDNMDAIREEALSVHSWVPWPEDHFSEGGQADWTVFPFMHTFPAYDASKVRWIESTCRHCPRTAEVLRRIPNIRTALFSRLGPQTLVASHRGWADLANHVLRSHCCLLVPSGDHCGLLVDEEETLHHEGNILVFDDSKYHRAFNRSDEERLVLIVDLLRPPHVALGSAKGGHTAELDKFIDLFK